MDKMATFNTEAELAELPDGRPVRVLDGQECKIIRRLTLAEADAEVEPMFAVQFEGGEQLDAFAYELTDDHTGRNIAEMLMASEGDWRL